LIAALTAAVRPAAAQTTAAEAAERGFQAIQRGDGDTAATMFRAALAMQPRDPVLLFGAGVAAHLQGRERDASTALKQALELEPRLTQASAWLGEIAYAEGDLDLAIRTYETALKYSPGNMTMRDRLETWRHEADVHSGLDSLRDGRFSFMFRGPVEEKLALHARTVVDAAFVRIGQALGAYPPTSITVILYTDEQFRDITGAPEWSGGGFDGQIRLPARSAQQNQRLFDIVLIHELTHAVVHGLAPRNVPAWLHEGLATYFQGSDAADAARRLAEARVFVPLSRLQGPFGHLSAAQAVAVYDESTVATRALIDRLGLRTIALVLQALDGGETFDRAIESHGLTMAALESDLARRVGTTPGSPSRK
jgi:tetratricopeptide (TPR) repeat protein